MGYMRHHAIIVTAWDNSIQKAHAEAIRLFHIPPTGPASYDRVAEVTDITPESVNGYRSFFIAPDGSKEGWGHSDTGDTARNAFVHWLMDAPKRDQYFQWVELQYADESGHNHIVRSNQEDES